MSGAHSVFGWLVVVTLALSGVAGAQSPGASAQPDLCVSCHEVLTVERLAGPVAAFKEDVHSGHGFRCVDCHGGDASAAGLAGMDPRRGFIGRPSGRQVLQVCGRCHADAAFMRRYNPALRVDQVTEYASSVHGRRLLDRGDSKVATCTSCHPAHNIRPPSDPRSSVAPENVAKTCAVCHGDAGYMEGYGIPTNQLARYEESIHWHALSQGDRSAPTCNDCHGNHGASPPGVDWVGNVCGQCHSVMADYFRASPHSQALARMGVPGCAFCHGNHAVPAVSDSLLGMGDGSVCRSCHVEGPGGGIVAMAMRQALDSLRAAQHVADSLLERAEQAGMEVSQAQFDLEGARTAMLQARAAVHAFVADSVTQHVGAGLGIATAAITRGREALDELRFRRLGLGVSTIIILMLIAGLVLKIRQVERKPA